MRCRVCFACLSLALSFVTGWSQEFRPGTESAASKELRRTAHRLHIPEERLKNARAVLRKATDLAGDLDPVPSEALPQIAESWIQLDRDHAVGEIEKLYTRLGTSAAKETDVQKYLQATYAAQALLNPLAGLDYEKAQQLIRQWPPSPDPSGDAADLRNRLEAQFQKQVASNMAYIDPGAALRMLPESDASQPPDYSMRGEIALQLLRNGDMEGAERIADQVIADFRQRTPDVQNVSEYTNFLLSLSMVDSSRFRDAFAILPPLLTDRPDAGAAMNVQFGDSTLALSPMELSVLNVFRGLQSRPELAVSTLEALPELKSKLESVGGLDNFLNPAVTSGPTNETETAAQESAAATSSRGSATHKDTEASLFSELRGKLRSTPGKVRTRLAKVASDPAHLELLIGLAERAITQDPDLSSLALDEAAAHLDDVNPIQRRVALLERLLASYRQCMGEIDPNLIRNGFVIADKLRQEEEAQSGSASGDTPATPQADALEGTLVSEYARDSYDAAMSFLNSKPDDKVKIMMLLRMLQTLPTAM